MKKIVMMMLLVGLLATPVFAQRETTKSAEQNESEFEESVKFSHMLIFEGEELDAEEETQASVNIKAAYRHLFKGEELILDEETQALVNEFERAYDNYIKLSRHHDIPQDQAKQILLEMITTYMKVPSFERIVKCSVNFEKHFFPEGKQVGFYHMVIDLDNLLPKELKDEYYQFVFLLMDDIDAYFRLHFILENSFRVDLLQRRGPVGYIDTSDTVKILKEAMKGYHPLTEIQAEALEKMQEELN